MNDNRKYIFAKGAKSQREEYQIIEKLIPKSSRVIDLGCGEGSLLKLLTDKKKIIGQGVEISSSGVAETKRKGLKAIKGQIDSKLNFKKNEFDYSVCNVTIQMVMYPEKLISEMSRISKYQIISFPNFAFLPNRLDLLINGRMPKFMIPGYDWFSTGHIHQLSISDFKIFIDQQHLEIIEIFYIFPKKISFLPKFVFNLFPNLFATVGIFLLRKIE